jgi:hypothetical protein
MAIQKNKLILYFEIVILLDGVVASAPRHGVRQTLYLQDFLLVIKINTSFG